MLDVNKLILNCVTDEQRFLIACCALEGMRIGEALNITASDFDIADMRIRIYGKGAKVRYVPLSKRAEKHIIPHLVIRQIEAPGEPMISYTDKSARYFITSLAKRAGIVRPISSHDLRATYATVAYAHSGDLATVQYLMGHSDPKTTMIYIYTPFATARVVAEMGYEDEDD
jgi:integrase